MILYNEEGLKLTTTKTKMPKFNKGEWDSVYFRIDQEQYEFYFSNKASRSNFYFKFNNVWYQLPMYHEYIGDLFNRRPELFTNKIMSLR